MYCDNQAVAGSERHADDIEAILVRLASGRGQARLTFHRGEERNNILFSIESFDPDANVVTAISIDRCFAVQFVPEDVARVEIVGSHA